jgi:hypothetical protein
MASTEYRGFLLVRKNFCIKTKVPPAAEHETVENMMF